MSTNTIARFLLLAVPLLLTSALAQTSAHTHTLVPADTIDGSKTPNLIPETTAWRLWMLAVTQNDPKHPELDQARQDTMLRDAGYAEDDLPVIRQTLADFKAAYDAMITSHNALNEAGLHPSLSELKTQIGMLVKNTQARMLSAHSERAERVKTFVNNEKRHMNVSRSEVQ